MNGIVSNPVTEVYNFIRIDLRLKFFASSGVIDIDFAGTS